jgi:c-di-GMP-binding flagellar brake protein YcgR
MDNNIFEVGLPIAIETYYKSYLTTELLGWKQDVFLITGVVKSSSKTGQLKVNTHCKMRFLKDGIAYGFETKILVINSHHFPVMFCKYPKAIEQCTIRQFRRINVNLPAQFLDMDGNFVADATIADISAGGCGLTIPVQEGKEPTCESTYKIIFSAMESDMHLCCAIRKIQTLKDKHELGVEFINVAPEEKERIRLFLDFCANVVNSKMEFILAKMKKTKKILGGQIHDISIIDMLQIFDQLDKEGIIHITAGKQDGFIAIKDGRVMDASLNNLHGEDALVDLLSFQEGEFHISANKVLSGHMNKPINFVLMDTCRLADERASLKEYFPGKEDKLSLQNPPETEDPETQTVVNALQSGASSVGQINGATGLSLIRAGLVSARLLQEGYLMKTT